MLFFGQHGYRVLPMTGVAMAVDQTWDGNNMDQYADDLAELIVKLDLKNMIMIGHSTGGGEVAHYIGRHGTSRVAKVVLVGAVPPLMLKTAANPKALPLEVFDGIRKGTAGDRSQFYKDLTMPFYGFNRSGAKVNEGLRSSFWLQGMQGGVKGQYDCIHEFSEIDYTDDLRKIDKPTLIIHGGDDQIVPIQASAEKTAKIVKGAQLKVLSRRPTRARSSRSRQVQRRGAGLHQGVGDRRRAHSEGPDHRSGPWHYRNRREAHAAFIRPSLVERFLHLRARRDAGLVGEQVRHRREIEVHPVRPRTAS